MKPHTLPIKRKPVTKGMFHRLSAVTRGRKQRVAAAATPGEIESDDGSSKIARALTIIFLIHIVAVGLIFIHQHFLEGRVKASEAAGTPAAATNKSAPAVVETRTRESLPRMNNGDKVYVVKPGDNYARIAEREGVEESALRQANQNVEIRAGLILSVPPRRIVAQEPPEVVRIREAAHPSSAEPLVNEDDGLVEAIDIAGAPRAVAVQSSSASPTPAAAGRTHTVKAGDNIWRISQQYKVKQDDLMKRNNITDARKVRVGMKLVIPD